MAITGTTDHIIVGRYFEESCNSGENCPCTVERITFSDGTIWTAATIRDFLLTGTDSADTMIDSRDGDTYLSGWGYGRATIYDYDWRAGNLDMLRFTAGVKSSDVRLERIGNSGGDLLVVLGTLRWTESENIGLSPIFSDSVQFFRTRESGLLSAGMAAIPVGIEGSSDRMPVGCTSCTNVSARNVPNPKTRYEKC